MSDVRLREKKSLNEKLVIQTVRQAVRATMTTADVNIFVMLLIVYIILMFVGACLHKLPVFNSLAR